jgi:hypothetical protein
MRSLENLNRLYESTCFMASTLNNSYNLYPYKIVPIKRIGQHEGQMNGWPISLQSDSSD